MVWTHSDERESEYVGRRMMRMVPPGKRARERPKARLPDLVSEDIRSGGVGKADRSYCNLKFKKMTCCGNP